jgi:hypothetical protein
MEIIRISLSANITIELKSLGVQVYLRLSHSVGPHFDMGILQCVPHYQYIYFTL